MSDDEDDQEIPEKRYRTWTAGKSGIPLSTQYKYAADARERRELQGEHQVNEAGGQNQPPLPENYPELDDDSDTGRPNVEEHVLQDEQRNVPDEVIPEIGNTEMDEKLRQPLHNHTNKILGGYIYDVTNIYHYNKLSKVCVGQILEINYKYFPNPNIAPRNMYYYMKIIDNISPMGEHFEKYFYCSKQSCQRLFGSVAPHIPCPICQTVDTNVFVMNSIEQQLKTMLENRKLWYFLEHRAAEIHKDGEICDITDGQKYKELPRGIYDITLITNTDGFALSKSSKLSGWPHLAIIVEVPPHLRYTYLLFNGLWVGHDKPKMLTFYRPLAETLQRLATIGFQWTHPNTNVEITSKVFAPMLSTDAQARYPIQNIRSFAALDGGCSWCELKGVRTGVNAGSATVYKNPKPPEPVPAVLRTAENMLVHAQTATYAQSVHGVRGPCIMSIVPQFDCTIGFVSDYMHSFCLGIIRQLINHMKDYGQNDKGFYIGANLTAINNKLKLIKTPDIIIRAPRSIDDLKSWKASELRNFALYFMLEVLDGEIEQKYIQALMLLIAAMYMLLQERVLVAEVRLAKLFIIDFYNIVGDLFGDRNLTYNMHQATHYADCVLNWGQLFHYSTFPFEAANGMLQRLIHGTYNIESEIANSFKIVSSLSILKQYSDDENIHHYDELKLLGATVAIEIFPNNVVEFLHQQNLHDSRLYLRATVHGIKYNSIYYTREEIHYNSLAMYNSNFGNILLFSLQNDNVTCVLQKIKTNGKKFKIHKKQYHLNHILNFTLTDDLICIPVDTLTCTVIKLSENTLCTPVNLIEINL